MSTLQRALGIAPTHPFRKFNLGFLAVIVLAILITPVFLAMHANGLLLTLVWIFAAAALIVFITLLLYGRGYSRDVDDILAGHYLVRWTYSGDEWAEFTREEEARTKREAMLTAGAGVVVAVLGAIFLPAIEPNTGAVWFAVLLTLIICMVIALGIYLSSKSIIADTSDARRSIYVTNLGVYKPWGYMPITGFNLSLTNAEIVTGNPSVLVLTSSYATQYGRQSRTVHVAIPRGRESEAKELIENLARR